MYRQLLALCFLLLIAPIASAQWNFEGYFPNEEDARVSWTHGLAVDGDGKVWFQNYYPFTGDSVHVPDLADPANESDCSEVTMNCRTNVILVFNPDGTEASFSPLSIVELPGGDPDTLGGSLANNDSSWVWAQGTGLAAGPNGNVTATQWQKVYTFDYGTGEVVAYNADPGMTHENKTLTAPSVADNGNVFVGGVFGTNPIIEFDGNLENPANVTDAAGGFNRTVLTLPDGNTVFEFNYGSTGPSTVHTRATIFDPWTAETNAFDGMRIESAAVHPTTGNIWVSAGSPLDSPEPPWNTHTWYEFEVDDVLANPIPTPLDSIVWNGPGDGRPRAIDFSPDGTIAYVGEFNLTELSVQKFMHAIDTEEGVSIPEVAELHANRPNPVSGRTTFTFDLHEAGNVSLRVFDLTGREVAVVAQGSYLAGQYSESFDASNLAAGVYAYTLEVDGRVLSRRMTVVR